MNGVMIMNSMLEYKGYHATIEFDADDDMTAKQIADKAFDMMMEKLK